MAVAFVKHIGTAQDKTASTSTSVTVPTGGVPVDDTVSVVIVSDQVVSSTCADARGNTYTRRSGINSVGPNLSTQLFTTKVTSALLAGDLITVTHASVTPKAMSANQFSGVDSVVDVTDSSSSDGSAAVTGLAATTLNADDVLLVAVGVEGPSGDTFTNDAPEFTALTRVGTSGGGATSNVTNNTAYKIASATGTFSYDATLGTSRGWNGVLVAMKAAAISGRSVPRCSHMPAVHRAANW